jgi:hypothetical protein
MSRKWTTTSGIALFTLIAFLAIAVSRAPADPTPPATGTAPHAVGADRMQRPLAAPSPAERRMDSDRRGEIRAIDEKIKTLRDEFKSQADPLETQLKSLREKFETDVKELQQQRQGLVEESESSDLRALNEEEASQLSALSDHEKADIDKIKQSYDAQREQVRQTYAPRRRDLNLAKH